MLTTERLNPMQDGIAKALDVLRAGGLCAFPTETVYGLGADARNSDAVARIFAAKGRPQFNPLIVHVANLEIAERYGVFNGAAKQIAQAFWPGPLTLVVPLRENSGLSPLVTSGLDSVGIRIPGSELSHELLAAFDGPVAGPSANPSGKVSPTSADHVLAGLSGEIEAVLDGGPCEIGLESTIIGCIDAPTLLRPGGLPREAVEACLGAPLAEPAANGEITAPGQLSSHYAPNAPVRLNADKKRDGEIYVGFGPCEGSDLTLSASGDLHEAATNLFEILHQANAMEAEKIAFAPIPEHGLGQAINDRLRRAAAPRVKY
ncbi:MULTISPECIES: L-threonylcarbamoyladenylate synthase [Halocynthiibacter]|uniref:Threonylcarbamoyl-AMP synthase n=1 Tax=Halocynthiibacter halioticoli TaxID=2986804 RepID=A0AAE3IW04_9RHOB|nr:MULTISPECIES: L-threonylcarbamoyladenylate synthase [Halocynthiibacter]MCV6823207.1 L-threonylcarbamoyladenylate synthase [Halocynthiibacter halioticoli]MCW4056208.1 L-threonylcarbamoyladenylate synthase [Halocynthiibacter sp. SDUM655004]